MKALKKNQQDPPARLSVIQEENLPEDEPRLEIKAIPCLFSDSDEEEDDSSLSVLK